MLNVVLNESKLVKDALNGKYESDKIIITLNLLIKYYYINGMNDRLKLREQILNFLKNNYENYKRAKWENTVINLVDKFLNTVRKNKVNVELFDIEEVDITKDELESIKSLNNIKLEKIAFVMLVYAKISNIMMNSNEGWINKSCATICKEAKVNLRGNDKEKIFNDLYVLKYIEQRKNNSKTNMRVCYINNDSEVELVIKDFNDVVYQYLIWKGERWKRCEGDNCDKWIKVKSNRSKYCTGCWKDKERELWRLNKIKNKENC